MRALSALSPVLAVPPGLGGGYPGRRGAPLTPASTEYRRTERLKHNTWGAPAIHRRGHVSHHGNGLGDGVGGDSTGSKAGALRVVVLERALDPPRSWATTHGDGHGDESPATHGHGPAVVHDAPVSRSFGALPQHAPQRRLDDFEQHRHFHASDRRASRPRGSSSSGGMAVVGTAGGLAT